MKLKKNILSGKNNLLIITFLPIFIILVSPILALENQEILEGKFIEIKILDKVSSKNNLLKIKIGKEKKFKKSLPKNFC